MLCVRACVALLLSALAKEARLILADKFATLNIVEYHVICAREQQEIETHEAELFCHLVPCGASPIDKCDEVRFADAKALLLIERTPKGWNRSAKLLDGLATMLVIHIERSRVQSQCDSEWRHNLEEFIILH